MKKLFKAKIFHKRFLPKENFFSYNGFYVKFSIDDLESLKSKIFSINRFNIFSFYTSDHGYKDERCLRSWAEKILTAANIKNLNGKIYLQTFPRVLGHVFNPVSFWYCWHDKKLTAVICEVNNTFGESHNYVLTGNLAKEIKELNKNFHVSPFYDVKGSYSFDFIKENTVKILYYDNNDLQLITSMQGKEIEWSNLNLIKIFLRYPVYSLRVLFLIHYQALKLFLKKCRFYKKPNRPKQEVTCEYSGTNV